MAAPKSKEDNRSKKVIKAKPVTGFAPMSFKDHTITQKRSGRYEVVDAKGVNLNGKAKETLLLDAKLLKPSLPKADAPTAT